ncbi:Uncharacterised protein [Chromobacterium violaceum]|uniref:Uncharacterized protein n=1 Tax=Chromobacterium violaceum TaxID=536 RepID=A0A3S4J3C6_CHRVL|nr:Uncharacterised protein [Chromobacterium violaceum]
MVAMRGLIAAAFFASEAFVPLILTTRYHWSLGRPAWRSPPAR